jgi:hypothetical protein
MAPRGRPKGTKYSPGIADAMWVVVEIKRDSGRHPVNRAAALVAKDIGKRYPTLSGERIRHLHAEVEKRREADPQFEASTSEALAEIRRQVAEITASGRQCDVLPLKLPGTKGDTYAVAILRKALPTNLVK